VARVFKYPRGFREYKDLREIWVLKVFRVHRDCRVHLETTMVL
jgi:hypothetical protein